MGWDGEGFDGCSRRIAPLPVSRSTAFLAHMDREGLGHWGNRKKDAFTKFILMGPRLCELAPKTRGIRFGLLIIQPWFWGILYKEPRALDGLSKCVQLCIIIIFSNSREALNLAAAGPKSGGENWNPNDEKRRRKKKVTSHDTSN